MGRSERKSGIELLRIITMLGVVLLHYNDGRALVYAQDSPNIYLLFFLESLCICAVNVFVLISGFFLSGTQRRNYIKPVELIAELLFFRAVFYVITTFAESKAFSVTALAYHLVPNSYFVMLYCTLYCVSPYLNRVFAGFTQKQWKRFLVTMLILFAVWPTITDQAEEILGTQWVGISTITLNGAHQGFNIINFMLLYSVGAYFRFNETNKLFKNRGVLCAGFVVTVCIVFGWALSSRGLELQEMRCAWMYHNPLVILMAVLLFCIFRTFTFKNRIINELAGASFTCFLLHGYFLNYLAVEKFATGNMLMLMGHILLVTVGCYLVSYVVYKLYGLVTGWFFNFLTKKITIAQVDDV